MQNFDEPIKVILKSDLKNIFLPQTIHTQTVGGRAGLAAHEPPAALHQRRAKRRPHAPAAGQARASHPHLRICVPWQSCAQGRRKNTEEHEG